MNQALLDEFIIQQKDRFKNKIQTLKLEHCQDDEGEFIYLVCIKIKKSQKEKGYGSAVMSEVVRLADTHCLRVKLWVTNIFGADLKRLYEFYRKHGFTLIKEKNDGEMIYFPQKKKKSL